MADLYELAVEWPSSTAQSVTVTGDFDKWSKSLHLTRSSIGNFTGSFKVPYGTPTRYKFIVNGEWAYRPDLPTERSAEGYVNNVYYVPLKVFSGAASNKPQNGTAGQFISELADTIAARSGTSSAFEYVASGLGKTIHTVVGVDPVNCSQIAIPTPISPHPPSELPSPNTANPTLTAPATNGDAIINPESEHTSSDPGNSDPAASDSQQQQSGPMVAPIVPIHIVPVYAKENCTIDPTKVTTDERSTPAVFIGLPSTTNQDAESKAKDEEATEEIKEILLPTVPIIPTLTTPTPLEKPADATTTGVVSQEVTEVVKEELAKPTPTIAATDAPVTPAVVEEEEKVSVPPAEETPTTTETSQKVEPESIPPQEKSANDTTTTTTAPDSKGVEHTKSMSEGSTTVKSSSRPTTPTGPNTTNSVPSTPASTVNKKSKAFPQLGKGSPSSKEHSSSHSMDELGVRKGNGSTMGKKKRHSSFFGKIKHMFHHHHEKEGEKGVH